MGERTWTPGPWHHRVFKDGRGGVWQTASTAAVFTSPNLDEADAALIASAPALYDALEEQLDWHSDNCVECAHSKGAVFGCALYQRSDTALRQARGEQP